MNELSQQVKDSVGLIAEALGAKPEAKPAHAQRATKDPAAQKMTGKALRALRKKHGLSVAKAAAMVHVSHRTWVRWETLKVVPTSGSHLFRLLMAAD